MALFDLLCNNIWTKYLTDMAAYFSNSAKGERYFNEYFEDKSMGKTGALIMYKNPWNDINSDPTSDYDWVPIEHIQKLCGSHFDKELTSSSSDTAYILFILMMTGPPNMVAPELVDPSMKTRSCLGIIKKDANGYTFKYGDHQYDHMTNTQYALIPPGDDTQ